MQEDNMEVPVPNKEVLSEKDTLVVSRLKYKIAIYTAVISLIGVIVTGALPLAKEIFTNEQRIILKKAEEQQKVQRILDSIREEKGKKAMEQMFVNVGAIYEQMGRLQRLLPRSASIIIYSTHDSGGIPRSGSPLHVTVLYQANNIELSSGKDYWQQKSMPEGYFQFAKRIYEQKEFYMENVENYPSVYSKETKDDIDFNGIRAIYGKLIKATPTAVYYLAVGYSEPYPVENFSPNLRNICRVYSSKFEKLIQSNSEL